MVKIVILIFIALFVILRFVPVSEDAFATSGCVPASKSSTKTETFHIITGQKPTFDKLKQDASLVTKRKLLQAACATDTKVRKLYLL